MAAKSPFKVNTASDSKLRPYPQSVELRWNYELRNYGGVRKLR
jgi:hypothetical protein